jgi:hypothetical protein
VKRKQNTAAMPPDSLTERPATLAVLTGMEAARKAWEGARLAGRGAASVRVRGSLAG